MNHRTHVHREATVLSCISRDHMSVHRVATVQSRTSRDHMGVHRETIHMAQSLTGREHMGVPIDATAVLIDTPNLP
jgi:hypothetical protein